MVVDREKRVLAVVKARRVKAIGMNGITDAALLVNIVVAPSVRNRAANGPWVIENADVMAPLIFRFFDAVPNFALGILVNFPGIEHLLARQRGRAVMFFRERRPIHAA